MSNLRSYVTCLEGLLVLLLTVGTARAQPMRNPVVAVTNVRVEADSQRVKIQYDVVGIRTADSVYIQVESRSAGSLPVSTVTGDVGIAIAPGTNKTVYWDYGIDGVPIADDIQATVTVLAKHSTTASQQAAVGGGATYALLSALAPGVGTILVQPNRKIGVRPLITVAYGGLLVYGLVKRAQSKKQYAVYESSLSGADYNVANRWHHQYLVAVGTAAAVWVADVVYTFLRGRKNDKGRSSATTRQFVVGYANNTPTVGIQLRF